MGQEEFDEFDEDAPPISKVVHRAADEAPAAGILPSYRRLCCGEIQMIEEMEDQVLELGFALYE